MKTIEMIGILDENIDKTEYLLRVDNNYELRNFLALNKEAKKFVEDADIVGLSILIGRYLPDITKEEYQLSCQLLEWTKIIKKEKA